MNKLFSVLVLILIVVFTGCKNNLANSQEGLIHIGELSIYGSYVTKSYAQREEGYDWVAVIVKRTNIENQINIAVRSRADKKKPTCTFDTLANKRNNQVYQAIVGGKTILFSFIDNTLKISVENPKDEGLLYYYCSGGANFGGQYMKSQESISGF